MKKRGSNRWIPAVVLLATPLFGWTQPNPVADTAVHKHEFTVKQAVDFALKNNVAVKNALLDIQQQQQVNR